MTQCFMITPIHRWRRWLRRFKELHPDQNDYSAMVLLDEADIDNQAMTPEEVLGPDYKSDPRWPLTTPGGTPFVDKDFYQIFTRHLYQDETGNIYTLDDAPPGAMFYADWMPQSWQGPDGRSLAVILPNGGTWHIDSRANNCDKQDDSEHRCWCRHGVPPLITVDKDCHTCNAGAGSVWSHKGQPDEWHGHLQQGKLVKC